MLAKVEYEINDNLYLLDGAKQILLNASFNYVDILSTKPEDQSFSF